MAYQRRLFVEQVFRDVVQQRLAGPERAGMDLLRAIDQPLRHAVAHGVAHDRAQRTGQILGGIPSQMPGQPGHGIGQLRVALQPEGGPLLPEALRNPQTSGLTVDVVAGMNETALDLK